MLNSQLDIMEPKVPEDIYKTHLEHVRECTFDHVTVVCDSTPLYLPLWCVLCGILPPISATVVCAVWYITPYICHCGVCCVVYYPPISATVVCAVWYSTPLYLPLWCVLCGILPPYICHCGACCVV